MHKKSKFVIYAVLAFLMYSNAVFCQNQSKEEIKRSNLYFWGEATADTRQEALDAALKQLTSSIAVMVKTEFNRIVTETSKDVKESVSDVLDTYSFATITNHQIIENTVNEKTQVFVYLDKREVDKVFEERRKKIISLFEQGIECEKNTNVGGALKAYYFSIILMNSIPKSNIEYNNLNLITEIPKRINDIIKNTKFSLKSDKLIDSDEREIILSITYNDKPAQTIDILFWEGNSYTKARCGDGEGVIHLLGSSINFSELKLEIEYNYEESKMEINEVNNLWSLVNKPIFNNARYINLKQKSTPLPGSEQPKEPKKADTAMVKPINEVKRTENPVVSKGEAKRGISIGKGSFKLNLAFGDSCKKVQTIGEETLKLLDLLKSNSVPKIEQAYSYDPFLQNKIINLVKYNKPSIIGGEIDAAVNKTLFGWELRKVRVLNNYKSMHKQSSEYLVLDFDKDGKLNDVTFGMLEAVYDKVQSTAQWGNDWINRQTIMKFVEKYRTAFLCRDINTIDSLFADEALIIVGRVLKKTNIKDGYKYIKIGDQPDAQTIQYTKKEYLKNLKNMFGKTEDIFIGYSTMSITRKNIEQTYGISMRQDYNSTGYADEGYLFLLVDFESKQPQIYVRVWQPKEWDEQTLIKLSNFNINR